MVRTYIDDVKELFESELVEIVKVKVFSIKYGEDEEISKMDFMDNFKTLIQSGVFANSVTWSFDTNTEDIFPECDLHIRGEIDGEEEVLVYVKLNKENTEEEAIQILSKWLREK